MTGEEAAGALKGGVEALFLEAREARPHERAALIEAGQGEERRHYVYVAFSYGRRRDEMLSYPRALGYPVTDASLEAMVGDTIKAVEKEFPDRNMAMIWRCEPRYEWAEAQRASKKWFRESSPAHHTLYCRLVAVPVGTIGNCRECGMVHEADAPCFLTERSIENLVAKFRTGSEKLFLTREQAAEAFQNAYGTKGQ